MYSYIRAPTPPELTELYFSDYLPEPDLVSTVRVFVFNKDKELLFIQEHGGNWDLPGGGKEENESPETAAQREVLEEAFVKVRNIKWLAYEKLIVTGNKPQKYKRHYPVTYIAYGVAESESLLPFEKNGESKGRDFLPYDEAVKRDGILFKNRHIMFDKILKKS